MTAEDAMPCLVVVDVQAAFDDPRWGQRNNPDAEDHVARLLASWRAAGGPLVHVRHVNEHAGGRFSRDSSGFGPKVEAVELPGEEVVVKTVNSAFIGTGLERFLRAGGHTAVVLCGLTTDHCVSTTARMAANLGFGTTVVSDATATFERVGPDGRRWSAADMHASALASLHGEFADVRDTRSVIADLAVRRR